MAKVAIITRRQNSSPKVLAESLHLFIDKLESVSHVFYKISVIKRLLKHEEVKEKYNPFIWFVYKFVFSLSDWIFLHKLKSFDAIIISDCSPLGFMKNEYGIEKLHLIMGKIPILFYEVYYLGNAPTQITTLKKNNHPTIERYNWHLSVTEVTEVKSKPTNPWSHIGIYLKGFGLNPSAKKKLLAIIDFAQPGFESYRKTQLKVLDELSIPYISLEKRYSIAEIRKIYQKGTFYFMQSYEAFGLPIAECLCYGNLIITPDSSWPMSWRQNQVPEIHGPGVLPECFLIYNNEEELKNKLEKVIQQYNLVDTPKKIFDIFLQNYPFLYNGNEDEMKEVLRKIDSKELIN